MFPKWEFFNMSDKHKELEQLATPLIEWLNKNYNPHCKIIIDTNSIEVVSGELVVSIK